MKRFLFWLLAVVLAVGLYIPCRNAAVSERGNKAIGGEIVLPLAVLIGAMCIEAEAERTEEKGGVDGG